MRLLIVDEELLPGGVETIRTLLIPALSNYCERITCVVPDHCVAENRNRFSACPNIEVRGIGARVPHLSRLIGAVARRIPARWRIRSDALEWLRNLRVRAIVDEVLADHVFTTCVFGQPPLKLQRPTSGFICDVNPVLPPAIIANMIRWVKSDAAIIAISEFTQDSIARLVPESAHKLRALGLGATINPTIAEHVGSAHNFLYPGAFHAHKDHLTLLHACRTLAREVTAFQCVFSGWRTDAIAASAPLDDPALEIVRCCYSEARAPLRDRVAARGWVSAEMRDSLFQQASCVVLPSRYEGFGLPLVEALEHGLPVICSDIPPFREQVARFEAQDRVKVFPAGDAPALARLMREQLQNPIARLSPKAASQMASRWTWDDLARALTEEWQRGGE